MGWSSLTPPEIQAVRTGLHLSVKEASEWIAGHTSPRTWQRYEDGTRSIPNDIEMELYALAQQTEELFEELHEQAFSASQEGRILQLKYYRVIGDEKISSHWVDEHGTDASVNWRIHQSVVSRVFREFGSAVELV